MKYTDFTRPEIADPDMRKYMGLWIEKNASEGTLVFFDKWDNALVVFDLPDSGMWCDSCGVVHFSEKIVSRPVNLPPNCYRVEAEKYVVYSKAGTPVIEGSVYALAGHNVELSDFTKDVVLRGKRNTSIEDTQPVKIEEVGAHQKARVSDEN
jgi:hypothetical protein